MAARMVRTKTPGVYKRGSRYVVVYYVEGRQRKEAARTLEDARALKAKREAGVDSGEFHEHARATLYEYAREWAERYQGRGRRGVPRGHPRGLPTDAQLVRAEALPGAAAAIRGHTCESCRVRSLALR